MGGFVDSGPVAGGNIKTGGIIDNLGPVKPPTVDTGDPTESFRPTFDDDGLGDIGEPPDFENTPDPDLTGGDAFKPTEILKRPSWRRQVDPNYPSEAKRAGKEGKVVLKLPLAWMARLRTLRPRRTLSDLGAREPPFRL